MEQIVEAPAVTTDMLDMRTLLVTLKAYRNGDFSVRMPSDLTGLPGKVADTLNEIIDMSSGTITEFERVARLVGKQGKVGERVELPMMKGSWEKLVESSNALTNDLVSPMSEMIRVIGSVAEGNLGQQVPLEIDGLKLKGQFLKSAETVNTMVARLGSFASEVTRVAREVGTEGILGGQAEVKGVSGTWKDLTDSVNGMASNLTAQVRNVAEVTIAVANGDLSRKITVDVRGEFLQLKETINTMVDQLRSFASEVTRVVREVGIEGKLGGQAYVTGVAGTWKDLTDSVNMMASNLTDQVRNIAQVTDVPSNYVAITSGLGAAKPLNIIVLPIVFENKVKAVVEMSSFTLYSVIHQTFLDQLGESIGIVLNTIEANMRTEELLKQSQSLAQELQAQQEELRQTNEELEDKAGLLEEQKAEVERKKREVEITKLSLEEKAEQLTLTSKYKSEFLSSMSHELRTPLNSLLILAQQLADNADRNLTSKQIEFAKTIQGSGKDLLGLINEILDLSKIESGTVTLDFIEVSFANLHDQIERTFRPVADSRNIGFMIEIAPTLPAATWTDEKRLLQVLKNLLSNAFKLTEKGSVSISIEPTVSGWSVDHPGLNRADTVISFVVTDTGIGVSADKQKLIFEAFQQADTGTSRKYGGTGLGLSISRELARLLGGELRLVSSEVDKGSTFALFVPLRTVELEHDTGSGMADDTDYRRRRSEITPPQNMQILDDRESIGPRDQVLLMVENDARFASILLAAAREKKFTGIVTTRGADALELVERFKPAAITLDLHLPDIDGWSVLERLKRNPATRHIPVQILSAEDDRARGLRYGAFDYLVKPVTAEEIQDALVGLVKFSQRKLKDLLVVGGNEKRRNGIVELIGNGDVRAKTVGGGKEALAALRKNNTTAWCLILPCPTFRPPGCWEQSRQTA